MFCTKSAEFKGHGEKNRLSDKVRERDRDRANGSEGEGQRLPSRVCIRIMAAKEMKTAGGTDNADDDDDNTPWPLPQRLFSWLTLFFSSHFSFPQLCSLYAVVSAAATRGVYATSTRSLCAFPLFWPNTRIPTAAAVEWKL